MSWQCTRKLTRPAHVSSSGIQIDCLEICNPGGEEKEHSSPHRDMKRYWKDGGSKSLDEILEEYRQARRRKRDQMWFLYIDLRKDFDDIERDSDRDFECCQVIKREASMVSLKEFPFEE